MPDTSLRVRGSVVCLIHFHTPYRHGGHLLLVAESEQAIDIDAEAHSRPLLNGGSGGGVVADVWEYACPADAQEAYRRLAAQGSRKRLCSICNPGNSRGAGRGNWVRRAVEEG